MRNYIKGTLEREGYSVHAMKSAEESLEELKSQDFQINLVNVELPGISGLELMTQIKELKPTLYSITMANKKSTINV